MSNTIHLLARLKLFFGEGLDAVSAAPWKSEDEQSRRDSATTYNRIRRLTFNDWENPGDTYEDKLLDQFYLYRFGLAYGFEYANIYRQILSDIRRDAFRISDDGLKVCSLGCGSLLDGWSLAFAGADATEERAMEQLPTISYVGVDRMSWPVRLFTPKTVNGIRQPIGDHLENCIHDVIPTSAFVQSGIAEYFRRNPQQDSNVFFFARILNELDEEYLRSLTDALRNTAFRADQITLVFLQSKAGEKLRAGLEAARKLTDAIKESGHYTSVESNLSVEGMIGKMPVQVCACNGTPYPCFQINSEHENIGEIDERFYLPKTLPEWRMDEVVDLSESIESYMKDKLHISEDDDDWLHVKPITSTCHTRFQMIRLTR